MHKTKSKENKKEIKTAIEVVATIITLVSITLIIYVLTNSETLTNNFSHQIQIYGISSLIILSFLLDLIPQPISPPVILITALAIGLNVHYAIIATILGSTTGSILGFAIGKKYMYKAVHYTTSEKSAKKITRLTNKYGKIIVPLAAISPIPYLPILLGAMNLTKKNFLIYGLLPRALSFIILGYSIIILR